MTAVEEQLKQKLYELKRVNEVVLDRLFCNTEILVNTCTYTCGFYPNVTTLRSGLCCRNSVCLTSVCLSSVVCNVGAPYSGG